MKKYIICLISVFLLIGTANGGMHLSKTHWIGGPVLGVSDTFTDTNGTDLNVHPPDTGRNVAWSQAPSTWDILNNKARNTPGVGSEIITGGSCVADTFTEVAPWTHDAGNSEYDCDGSQAAASELYQTSKNFSANTFYVITYTIRNYIAGNLRAYINNGAHYSGYVSGDGIHTQYLFNVNAGVNGSCGVSADADFNGSVTNISLKPLTTANLWAGTNTGFSSGYEKQTNTTIEANSILGAYICGDSASNPSNAFVAIANRTAGNFQVYALNSGTWTNLINTAFTYAADAEIHLLLDENKQYLYAFYNNALIGTRQDVSSYTTIINNTYHGMFSTSSGNSVASIDIKPLQFGADLLAGWDFTSGWDLSIGGNVSISDADTFVTTGVATGIFKDSLFTIGALYYVSVSGSSSGDFSANTGLNLSRGDLIIDGFGSGYCVSNATFVDFYLRNATAGSTSVSALSVRQVQ